jgi:uncharacterized protein (DUF1778 family)
MTKKTRLTYNLTVRLTPDEDALLDDAAEKMSATLGWRVGKGTIMRAAGIARAREILHNVNVGAP